MKVKQTLSLPSDDLEWFEDAYRGISLSAVMTLMLHEFRMIHRDTGVTPRKISKDVAKETKERIDEGMFEKSGKRNTEDE